MEFRIEGEGLWDSGLGVQGLRFEGFGSRRLGLGGDLRCRGFGL